MRCASSNSTRRGSRAKNGLRTPRPGYPTPRTRSRRRGRGEYLTPTTLVDGTILKIVRAPELKDGERTNGKPDVFGAFALYLVLAARWDPVDALKVADGWGGDSMVTFRRDDTDCVRVSFAGRTREASTAIYDALRD